MFLRLLMAAIVVITSVAVHGAEIDVPEIAMLKDFRAARASSHDSTGGNRDSTSIATGETVTIADLQGPGIIVHCWFTIAPESPRYLSGLILRMTWDDADEPAVESPWGAFFGLGHDECADIVSGPVVVMAGKAQYIRSPPGRAAFNCYFSMPFRRRARIEVINRTDRSVPNFFYHIDWQRRADLPDRAAYFHARYHNEETVPSTHPDSRNPSDRDNYVILETTGHGHYIGCTLHVHAQPDEAGKWYEGDDMIVVDGQPLQEAILGTGSEDYFNMAWGVRRHFQSPCFGTSYHQWPQDGPEMLQYGKFSIYRWHLLDPIPFCQSIRVSIEHGHDNDAANRYASVAYWYAAQP